MNFGKLFFLPLILTRLGKVFLPKPIFVAVYQPSSEIERLFEQDANNIIRRVDYHTKKWGSNPK